MTQEPKPRFQAGDVVRIVGTPYMECPFVWIGKMTELCGHEATITNVFWAYHRNTHGYLIDIDDCYCTWCENCFEVEPDLEESGVDPSVLFQ